MQEVSRQIMRQVEVEARQSWSGLFSSIVK